MRPDNFLTSIHGVRIPGIIYGTAWKKEHTARLVEKAIMLGFRGIDTACQPKHYNEPGVGAGVAACLKNGRKDGLGREDLYLQTKFTTVDGQDPKNIPYDPKASLAEQVRQSFEVSRSNLRTTYLDCLVLHSPIQPMEKMMQVWREMEAIFDTGAVRQLGISNCYSLEVLEAVYRAARVRPVIVQNRFYAKTGYDRDIRAFCLQHQMFYQSFWTLTANPQILVHHTLQDLASRYGRSPAQVLFRYLAQVGVIPLTGTTSTAHMLDDLAIFEFELQGHERDDVTTLLRPP